jgi:DNA topoisomerase I
MNFYKPYTIRSETQLHLPETHNGNILRNAVMIMTEKLIQPPHRFNQASLLEKMETENIGTKVTRSDIINTLFKRNYISNTATISYQKQKDGPGGVGIVATDVGFEIIHLMRKYVPNIVSTDLTRSMEEQLEEIESGIARSAFVIEYATAKLKEAITYLKEKEIEIGNQITEALDKTRNKEQIILGTCPICGTGDLKIMRSNRTKKRFVGCSNYTSNKCKATAPLPQKTPIKTTGKMCLICRWPILEAVFRRREKYYSKFCVNMKCPTKNNNNDLKALS